MNSKRFLQIGLGFALGMVGIGAVSAPAQAQVGVQSDITGAIITTSDIVGGFGGGGVRQFLSFRSSRIQAAVNDAAVVINQRLAAGTLPVVARGNVTATAIPGSVQQSFLVVLTSTGNVNASATQITNALVSAGASSTLAQNLVANLVGLTGGTVSPAQLTALVNAYNALINASGYDFLNEPPEELRAIQSILAILLNAATVVS